MERRLFTSEAVSEGHPDKVADQISDAILDAYLAKDKDAHVACETLVTTGLVVLAGEVKAKASIDVDSIVRKTVERIGYCNTDCGFDANSCGIINTMHRQSQDIDRGVSVADAKKQGAGDQGIMFGYATDETEEYMPMAYVLANKVMQTLAYIRKKTELMPYLRPDAKSQVTIIYDDGIPVGIDTILVSTQHKEFASDRAMQEKIRKDIEDIVLPMVVQGAGSKERQLLTNSKYKLLVNPTGKFVIGGPHGDTGLTGRKIIVDTYGGAVAHGGGAFSGKDPSKVDRSAAYAARHIAKSFVESGIVRKMEVQLGYAIGVAQPLNIYVNGVGYADGYDNEMVAGMIGELFDLSPYGIITSLGLKNPIYEQTAAYGHFGRRQFEQDGVTFFPWEKSLSIKNL